MLFLEDFNGLVIKNELKGIDVYEEGEDRVRVRIAAGEDWDGLVRWAVSKGLSGIENLAFIPGTVGAAVVQNIAAYGQNFEEVFLGVGGISLTNGESFYLNRTECQFSYRDSVFKKSESKELFITFIEIELSKKPVFSTSYHSRYESLSAELEGKQEPYSVQDIYDAVVQLRLKKLPDWRKVGTAGSFFKNPVVSKHQYEKISEEVKELQCYPVGNLSYDGEGVEEENVKIPAGRLLDELGWKGKQIGRVGTFEKTALVVVNLGAATGEEILEFTEKMKADVLHAYGISLEREVCVV